ncbi:uncharacterized protein LOC133906587 [Phragmites australis]|uniref:uncharacterized protein LOC133906587 n=1 Tax=Phragmites australis TaxID=29695 RepID=UPI002D76F7FA|nr:uncharacterized protein LOC133906587 [Phragmites australis]
MFTIASNSFRRFAQKNASQSAAPPNPPPASSPPKHASRGGTLGKELLPYCRRSRPLCIGVACGGDPSGLGFIFHWDRRNKKRDMRSLWIERINAGTRLHGVNYGNFMHGLMKENIQLNRKVLTELSMH